MIPFRTPIRNSQRPCTRPKGDAQSRDLGGCNLRHVIFLVEFRLRAKSRPPSHPVQLAKRSNLIRQTSGKGTRWRRQDVGVQYASPGTAPRTMQGTPRQNTWHLVSRLRVQITSGLVAQQLSLTTSVGLENGLVTPLTHARSSARRWRCSSRGRCITCYATHQAMLGLLMQLWHLGDRTVSRIS